MKENKTLSKRRINESKLGTKDLPFLPDRLAIYKLTESLRNIGLACKYPFRFTHSRREKKAPLMAVAVVSGEGAN